MATPFLDTLSRAARAAWPFVQRGVREGLTSRSIAASLEAGGLPGIRRQVLLDLMRFERAGQDAGRALQLARPDLLIRPELLPTALHRIRRAMSVTVQVTGTLMETGAKTTRQVTVTFDRPMRKAEAEAAAREAVMTSAEKYGMEVESVSLIGGRSAAGVGVI